MQNQPQTSPATMVVVGLITGCAGLYFVLVGADVLPPPSRANAPAWVVVAAGLAFLLGGLAVVAQALGRADDRGELPPDAPAWTRLVQQLAVLAVVFCLASIGTWVALAGQADKFSGPPGAGVMVMRIAFGLGALLTWLFFIALARRSLRQLLGQEKARSP